MLSFYVKLWVKLWVLTRLTLVSIANKTRITTTISLLSALIGDTLCIWIASAANLIGISRLVPLTNTTIANTRRLTFALVVSQQIQATSIRGAESGSLVTLIDIDARESIGTVETGLALTVVALLRFRVENTLGKYVAVIRLIFARIRRCLVRCERAEIVGRREAHLAFRVGVCDEEALGR